MSRIRYLRKNGAMEEAPRTPFMGAAHYAANGYLTYSGELPLPRLDIAAGTVVELPEKAGEPSPRAFSKLRLCEKLEALGLWQTLKEQIEAEAGDYWTLAHDVKEDHPKFLALFARLAPLFEASGVDLDALLAACAMEHD